MEEGQRAGSVYQFANQTWSSVLPINLEPVGASSFRDGTSAVSPALPFLIGSKVSRFPGDTHSAHLAVDPKPRSLQNVMHSLAQEAQSFRSLWNIPADVRLCAVSPIGSRDELDSQRDCNEPTCLLSVVHDLMPYASMEDMTDPFFTNGGTELFDVVRCEARNDDEGSGSGGVRIRKKRGGAPILDYSPEKDSCQKSFVRCIQKKSY